MCIRDRPLAALSVKDTIMNEWSLYGTRSKSVSTVWKSSAASLRWTGKHTTFENFPTVAKLSRKYLAVQASSAASERLFSGGNTITEKRNRLS